jgi:hypothetical protein
MDANSSEQSKHVEDARCALGRALRALEQASDPASLFEAYTETRQAMGYINLANNSEPPRSLKDN